MGAAATAIPFREWATPAAVQPKAANDGSRRHPRPPRSGLAQPQLLQNPISRGRGTGEIRVDERQLAQAVAVTQALYRVNVFPAMNVTWGTYVNQLGHTEADGCFRCHDDRHRTTSGLTIAQNCDGCHSFE